MNLICFKYGLIGGKKYWVKLRLVSLWGLNQNLGRASPHLYMRSSHRAFMNSTFNFLHFSHCVTFTIMILTFPTPERHILFEDGTKYQS